MRIHPLFLALGGLAALPLSALAAPAPQDDVARNGGGGGGNQVAPEYGQCGGQGWNGPKKCPRGWACTKSNDWYSQCKKADSKGCGNPEFAQCGGIGYTGEKCCWEGTKCVYSHDYWSACSKVATTTHKPTTTHKTTTRTTTTKKTTTRTTTTKKPTSTRTTTTKSTKTTTHKPTTSKTSSTKTTSSKTTTTTSPGTTPPPRPSVTSKPEELRLSPKWNVNAPPQRRVFDFEIEARPGSPDGFNRSMLVVNGQYPGPLIEANAGDTIVVNVQNSLDFEIALHWHGIQQNGTVAMDGPSGVTQCPIGSGRSFTYEFKIVGQDPYGTLWWHAHRSGYYADGIIGPLIVHSPDDPLVRGRDFDVEQVIMFSDFYHEPSDVIVGALNTPEGFNGSAVAPSPQSGLLNGYGIYNCSFAADDEPCFQHTEIKEFVFPPDSLIRLRFINSGAHPMVWFSVDEHELAVVEADDTPVEASLVHRIPVNIAQRYSGILNTTGHQVGDSFYLRSQINLGCLGLPFPDLNPQTLIVIRIGFPDSELGDELPTSQDWNDPTVGACIDLDESALVPLVPIDAPSTVSQISAFNSSFVIDEYFKWTINDVTFENFAYNPLLHQVARGETIDPSRAAVITAGLESMDLIINNIQGADHPFHLHNIRMFVLSRGEGILNVSTAATLEHNLVNPIRRDTIGVPPGTWVVVRLITDIPGVHLFHCHILFHQAVGLLGALVVQPEVIQQQGIPEANLELCAGGNISIIDPGRKRALPTSPLPGLLPRAPVPTAAPVPVHTGFAELAAKKAVKKSLFTWW